MDEIDCSAPGWFLPEYSEQVREAVRVLSRQCEDVPETIEEYEIQRLRGFGLDPRLTDGERRAWAMYVRSVRMVRAVTGRDLERLGALVLQDRVEAVLEYVRDVLPADHPARPHLVAAVETLPRRDPVWEELGIMAAWEIEDHIERQLGGQSDED